MFTVMDKCLHLLPNLAARFEKKLFLEFSDDVSNLTLGFYAGKQMLHKLINLFF